MFHQRREHDRALARRRVDLVDAARCIAGLVERVDEGDADLAEAHLELAQHGMAEGFGGDAGAIGNKKHGADCRREGGAGIGCHQSGFGHSN